MYRNIGIDIGTTFFTAYSIDKGEVISRFRHEGKIAQSIKDLMEKTPENARFIISGKSGKEFCEQQGVNFVEESVAISSAIKRENFFSEKLAKIMDIGASSLTLYTIKNNKVTDIAKNALCAAGTGLFLEEQAERLNLDLEKMGALDIENPPLIASRCTVFAKSDIIHHQQEGRSKKEMWSGLCRALAVSAVNTLFRGEDIYGDIMLIGGVSLNPEVVRWFKTMYPKANWIILPKISSAFVAFGASFLKGFSKDEIDIEKSFVSKENIKRTPPLQLKKSKYPFFVTPKIDDLKNEIRIHEDLKNVKKITIGMDIGSTSTKLIAIDIDSNKPVFDIYRKTGGEPIEAAKRVFKAVFNLIDGKNIKIVAFGTTGSGRKLVGEIFGADKIVNEITAHGTGTATYYPDVETIFEIGGQDAKYIRLKNGMVQDVNMNYVCAAGTGSFIEEQARKLDFDIFELGNVVENVAPPVTSDRCTVFMEQDLRTLLKQGFNKKEAISAVHYSIIQNYINRVVGNRYISKDKVFFQGATARNKGLVAAIENLLDVEVVVSPFCHVMGSIGAALIAQQSLLEKHQHTKFIGEKSISVNVSSRTEVCKLCTNYCRINFIKRDDGREFSWGYQCGRDPEETTRKKVEEYNAFIERNKIFFKKNNIEIKKPKQEIIIPNSLTNYTYYPMWKYFFNKLGITTKLSGMSTTRTIKRHASKVATGDFCFPVKAAMGHTVEALEKGNIIFQPHFISDKDDLKTAASYYCPYVESNPSVIRSALQRSHIKTENYITPVIDLRMTLEKNADNIYKFLKTFNIKRKDVREALKEAFDFWSETYSELKEKGEALLKNAKEKKKPTFVIIGRPYNIHDTGVNLGIPEKIASFGYDVIPLDMLAIDSKDLENTNYFNLFWNYGQKIIATLKKIRNDENIFPIYLSNFNCGPDSFILSYAEDENKGKPMLILELDEHDSDGGYQTRIEAFIDVVEAWYKNKKSKEIEEKPVPDIYTAEKQVDLSGKLWIPPMHDPGDRFFAAAFRGHGFDSEVLQPETKEIFHEAKKFVRGGECLPMTLTLGGVINEYKKAPDKKHVLFMPTSEGPCRFGQYNMLERLVFHNNDFKNIDILAPSSVNSYQGLSEDLRRYLMHTMMSADILFKLRTKMKPYEKTKGDTLEVFENSVKTIEKVLEKKKNPRKYLKEIASQFLSIPHYTEKKPLVGIVGEIYVRCNKYANDSLVDIIEENGGEAWLSPMHEWVLYTAFMQSYLAKQQKFSLFEAGESLVKNIYLFNVESSYYKAVDSVLHDRKEPHIAEVVKEGEKYMPKDFVGESILTVGRAVEFAKNGADMVVNAAPFGCMPGTITSSIFLEIKDAYNIPIISQFYDGDIKINDKVVSLLQNIIVEKSK